MIGRIVVSVGFLATLGLVMAQALQDCTAPPPPVSPKLCCPFMDQGSVFNETIYETCWGRYAEFPMVPIPGGGLSGGPAGCAAECFFSALDFLIPRPQYTLVDFYAMDRHVKGIAAEDRYGFVREAMQYCVNEANVRAPIFAEIQRRPAVVEGLDNCNPISGFTFSCMHVYAIRNCPNWTPDATEGCDELLDFYNQCPFNPY
uniref:Putative odorant binding protein 50e n=2 Tax=Culex tarsalis TaxID=7177 RepID=A0A1Q3FTZ4_CULTA